MIPSDNENAGISSELSKNKWNKDHLHVYLKIKDNLESYKNYEILDSKTIVSKVLESSNLIRNAKEEVMVKKYTFSKIFGPKTTQLDIFNELVKTKLVDFIKGHNSSLLTYGVSNSGKTYTIIGTADEPGVIPRSLECLFHNLPILTERPKVKPLPYGKVMKLTEKQLEKERLLKEQILTSDSPCHLKNENIYKYCKMRSDIVDDLFSQQHEKAHPEVSVWISFAEIYNEHIYDLLRSSSVTKKEKLKLGCANGETYVKNLNLVHVQSATEAYQVLQYGLHNLNYAKTNINEHSSRSHSIFTIWLTNGRIDSVEGCRSSHFNFCDLAGSERSKKTLNVGERLKESNNINTSLFVLGRCLAAVRKMQQSTDHQIAPFRESKLTQLFQKALSGYEDISIIVNINPCREDFDETQHVLNFSAVAQDIVSMPWRNQKITQLLSTILKPLKEPVEEESYKMLNTEELMKKSLLTISRDNNEERTKEIKGKLNEMRKKFLQQDLECLHSSKSVLVESSCTSVESAHLGSSGVESDISASSSYVDDMVVNELKKKLEQRDSLIAEHHKTISIMKKQIQRLTRRVQEMEEKKNLICYRRLNSYGFDD